MHAEVWWGGYAITVTGGTYDSIKHTLHIDAAFTNTSTQQTELRQLGSAVTIVWNGEFLPSFVTAATIPVGTTANGQVQVQPPAGFVVADAVLTFGKADEHQALVPLSGAAATSDQPAALTIVGTVKMGRYITFKSTSASLVPASCSGYPVRIAHGALAKNLVSIVLWGTVTSTDPFNYGHIDTGYVVLPDGTKTLSVPGMSLSVPNKTTIRDVGMCFAVPAPGSASYTLKMYESRSKKTGALVFVIP
jgi:hypothetical protein